MEYDHTTGLLDLTSYAELEDTSPETIQHAYLFATDDPETSTKINNTFASASFVSSVPLSPSKVPSSFNTASAKAPGPGPEPRPPKAAPQESHPYYVRARAYPSRPTKSLGRRPTPLGARSASPTGQARARAWPEESIEVYAKTKKKYKPVAKKVRPVASHLPEHFRIVRNRVGDPLKNMPQLDANPPPFKPTGRYTQERHDLIDEIHREWLSPEELRVLHDLMCKQELAFAWEESERGRFRQDMFPPVRLAVVDHVPYNERNAPVPPGIFRVLLEMIKQKIDNGVYEPSNASYRTRWFCVLKKDGKLRIVHSLEPLNRITIQHSGVPPVLEHIAEQFGGRPCGSTFDLYVGYDEREIHPDSRDLTTFQTPFGAMRLTTLPMGWTNSVPIFHDDIAFILQPEMPDHAANYIDDVFVMGPKSAYLLEDGTPECIPENPGVRRFIWEQLQNDNRIIQRIKHAGGTLSGKKSRFAPPRFGALGSRCTPEGRVADPECVQAVVNWTVCKTVSDVRAFLGTVGVARIFIKDFAKIANPLNKLLRKDAPFEWGPDQVRAMEDLKSALVHSPALRAIDYEDDAPVILAVDTSKIAVGYLLCQEDRDDPRQRYYTCSYHSCTTIPHTMSYWLCPVWGFFVQAPKGES